MIKIDKIIDSIGEKPSPDATLTLDHEKRQKCLQRVHLDNGEEAGLMLPRGTVIKDGDILEADNGMKILVCAAQEELSIATSSDPTLFSKACYHLGNRHAAAQIDNLRLLYRHDHVLDDMLKRLGLTVTSGSAPFFPEHGAYHSHGNHSH